MRSAAAMAGERPPVLFLARLGLAVVGGLLVLPAVIGRMPVFADVACACLLGCALLVTDSVRRRRSAAAILPTMLCLSAAVLVGSLGLLAGWRWVPELSGVAAALSLAQLVYNWPTSDKPARDHLARALAQSERPPTTEQ